MRKVYFDKTVPENACTSVYVRDAEVIAAGTIVYSMSVKEKNAEYQKFAEEHGICFIFDDKPPKIDFYTVPQVDIFATDGKGGLFGTIGSITDLDADIPICYMDQSRTCFLAAENGNAFLEAAGSWREHLSPYEGIIFYRSKEEAKQRLDFIEAEQDRKMNSKEGIENTREAASVKRGTTSRFSHMLLHFKNFIRIFFQGK